MPVSRQSLSSIAELLGTLSGDSAGLLLYKHLGMQLSEIRSGALGRLEALESADPEAVWELIPELVRSHTQFVLVQFPSTPSTAGYAKCIAGLHMMDGSLKVMILFALHLQLRRQRAFETHCLVS